VPSETPAVVLVGEAEETRVTRVVVGVDIKADEFMRVFVAGAVARVVLAKSTAAKIRKYMIQCTGNTDTLILGAGLFFKRPASLYNPQPTTQALPKQGR